MELKILKEDKVVYYKIIDGKEWDKLNETQREIISYNGEWKLAKKIREEDLFIK